MSIILRILFVVIVTWSSSAADSDKSGDATLRGAHDDLMSCQVGSTDLEYHRDYESRAPVSTPVTHGS